MIKEENPIAVTLLGFLTLGLYTIFWLYQPKKQLANIISGIPSLTLLFMPVYIGVLLVVLSTVFSGTGSYLNFVFMFIVVITLFATIPVAGYWFYKFSKAVDIYSNGRAGTGFLMTIWCASYVFGVIPIYTGLVQKTLNEANNLPENNPNAG